MNEEELEKAGSYALRFLSFRPRSEFETRSRLRWKFTNEVVDRTVQNLKDQGLLDDIAFASAWTHSRITYRPRSASMVSRELFQKGVSREVARDAIRDLDDDESAFKAAQKFRGHRSREEYGVYRQRMWGYLQRRGFNAEVISRVSKRLWEEKL
jgi:regulatory protein